MRDRLIVPLWAGSGVVWVGDGYVWEVSELLVPVESVSVYEFVGDLEPSVCWFEVCRSAVCLVDEGHGRDALGVLLGDDCLDALKGSSCVDDVFNDQHVTSVEGEF